ncbi:MAG: acyltransferase family protein [Pseudomonadota bacterium]
MRFAFWDNWKGVAIIAVVLIHASSQAASFPVGSWNNDFGVVVRQVLNFAVALFFFISGYFACSPQLGEPRRFISRRLLKILYPYVFWSLVFIAISQVLNGFDFYDAVIRLIVGTGVPVGYFVVVLVQLVLLAPLLSLVNSKGVHLFIIFASFLLSISFTYYFRVLDSESFLSNFPYNGLPFFVWMPFFCLGYFLARFFKQGISVSSYALLGLYLLGVVFSLIEGFYWVDEHHSLAISQLKASTYLTSIVFCLLVYSLKGSSFFSKDCRFLSWLGVNSYVIYLTHMLFIIAIKKASPLMGFVNENSFVYLVFAGGLTIVFCSILAFFINVMFPESIKNKISG